MTAKIAAAVIKARISHRVITLIYQTIADAGRLRPRAKRPQCPGGALLARIHLVVAD